MKVDISPRRRPPRRATPARQPPGRDPARLPQGQVYYDESTAWSHPAQQVAP
jgi:hypothetical protein